MLPSDFIHGTCEHSRARAKTNHHKSRHVRFLTFVQHLRTKPSHKPAALSYSLSVPQFSTWHPIRSKAVYRPELQSDLERRQKRCPGRNKIVKSLEQIISVHITVLSRALHAVLLAASS